MNISLSDIKYILAIASEESITKAASKLFISQPSLSQALKRIEDSLGTKLFLRTHNQIKLTQAGELFVETGWEILQRFEDLEERINMLDSDISEMVYLGLPFFLGKYLAPRIIARHRKYYPEAHINLVEDTSRRLEELLANGNIDLALLPTPLINNSLNYRTLFHSRMVLLVPADDPLNEFAYEKESDPGKYYIDIRLINKRDFLLVASGQRIRQINELIFQKANIAPHIIFTSKSIETIQRISATGMGLAIIPLYYLEQFGSTDTINYYFIEPEYDYSWSLVLAYVNEETLRPATRRVIETIESLCKQRQSGGTAHYDAKK